MVPTKEVDRPRGGKIQRCIDYNLYNAVVNLKMDVHSGSFCLRFVCFFFRAYLYENFLSVNIYMILYKTCVGQSFDFVRKVLRKSVFAFADKNTLVHSLRTTLTKIYTVYIHFSIKNFQVFVVIYMYMHIKLVDNKHKKCQRDYIKQQFKQIRIEI